MSTDTRAAGAEYGHLTVSCAEAGLERVPGDWDPVTATEPDEMPDVAPDAAGNAEPLVPVTDGPSGRVVSLDAYRRSGWPQAPQRQLARTSVVVALHEAAAALPEPYGIAVFDAWRPLELQLALYDAAYSDPALPPGYVSEPSTDPATPPPHLTGGTVDCTLTHDSRALELGTTFDAFNPHAGAASLEAVPCVERDLRRMLCTVMRDAGFVPLDAEWWHYELGTRRWAALRGTDPLYGAATPRP